MNRGPCRRVIKSIRQNGKFWTSRIKTYGGAAFDEVKFLATFQPLILKKHRAGVNPMFFCARFFSYLCVRNTILLNRIL
jgi:hypothetical protein